LRAGGIGNVLDRRSASEVNMRRSARKGGAMGELWGIARFKLHEGKLEEFKHLSAQAMEVVRTKDTGTLQYDTYFNDDQSECVVLERYRDSEAAIEHAANLGDVSAAILATVSVVHGELLGEPSAELRAKLADGEVPQLFTPYQSM
jgi:quinol monooxygenase YgiN